MAIVVSPFDQTRLRTRSRLGQQLQGAPVVPLVIIATLMIVAVFAPWIAPHDPLVALPGAKINIGPVWETGDWSAM